MEKDLIVEAKKRLLGLDLSVNSNQPAMKSIITDLGIETEGNSAEILRTALTPIKESLLAETQEAPEEVVDEVEVTEEAPEEVVDEVVKVPKGTFIMNRTRLDWGLNSKNHFYADKKPEISAKKMGKYADTILIWLKAGWIKKGSYK